MANYTELPYHDGIKWICSDDTKCDIKSFADEGQGSTNEIPTNQNLGTETVHGALIKIRLTWPFLTDLCMVTIHSR